MLSKSKYGNYRCYTFVLLEKQRLTKRPTAMHAFELHLTSKYVINKHTFTLVLFVHILCSLNSLLLRVYGWSS